MTWNPAAARTGAWCRQSRPVSGNPCSSTTGRPAPNTSYSIPTPSTLTRLMCPPSPATLPSILPGPPLGARRGNASALRRRHPGGDLGAGVDAELVQDAPDMAVHGALGDEQPRPDLLVGQALSDQPRDVGLPLGKRPRPGAIRSAGLPRGGPAERKPRRSGPVQALSRPEPGVEPRCPERRQRGLPGVR